jgi:hypothetical protein
VQRTLARARTRPVSLRCPPRRCRAGDNAREHGGGVRAAGAWPRPRLGVTGVIAGPDFQRVIRWRIPEDMISYRHDNGAWLNTAEDHALALATPAHSPGWTLR